MASNGLKIIVIIDWLCLMYNSPVYSACEKPLLANSLTTESFRLLSFNRGSTVLHTILYPTGSVGQFFWNVRTHTVLIRQLYNLRFAVI